MPDRGREPTTTFRRLPPSPQVPAALLAALVLLGTMPIGRAAPPASQGSKSSSGEVKDGPLVIRGCVTSGTLTHVSTESADVAGTLVSGATYRLAGPKRLLKPLRSDHNGHYEEVTGKVKGEFAPSAVVRKRDMGKVSVQVGVGNAGGAAQAPRVPEMPSIEVESARHLDERCPY